MTIKEFIEKAIEGGWKQKAPIFAKGEKLYCKADIYADEIEVHVLFLDPLAWQAVGKVEAWKNITIEKENGEFITIPEGKDATEFAWRHRMKKMTDALIEGKSLEEYIATL